MLNLFPRNARRHASSRLGLMFLMLFGVVNPGWANDYRISAEDIVNVTVYDEPEMSIQETRVSSNGTVSMPLIGDVRVAGLTTAEVAARIESMLADGYLKKPKVRVSIHAYRQVFVNGEVKQPGGYSYQDGLTVQKAVVLAGGFTERASTSKITLVSEKRPGESKRVQLNHPVRPGDIITVGESFF